MLALTDGKFFYYGKLQVEALDVENNRNTFPELIFAASSDLAFGNGGYYNAHNGKHAGSLPFTTSVYGLSQDGRSFWAFDPNADMLHYYEIQSEKK